ncbi:MAG: alpha/beta fold hydrolase [Bacteroidetes bacterium]|nr:MAG: alpha/beta fold hydrolase [Bacteroidota bacterium]REK07062.1 MAG: alpha/beta fold hydrolase [Bacteroidota bacterium]REK33592.1 MAG: alpha/beta fold hydrolase [Bacteroidota bacterium]REK48576.1 MAG: alpha/beta fold hydrolase [Bacteroidota bacterium]
MKKALAGTAALLTAFYVIICILVYFFQEKLIFFPEKLKRDFSIPHELPYEEHFIHYEENDSLHAMHFKSEHSKGLILYLHGNAGSLRTWSQIAAFYTVLGYDLFMPDYPSYGKSTGKIRNEESLQRSIDSAYSFVKKLYPEDKIIVLGYSLGTGPAARLASQNNPSLLILQAPFTSLTDMKDSFYPFIPDFLLRYTFQTDDHLPKCRMPVIIFHGDSDEVIPYISSLELSKRFKTGDTLITLPGQRHNGMSAHPLYKEAFENIISADSVRVSF